MKSFKKKTIAVILILLVIIASVYYYFALPAINIHSPGFWKFILFVFVAATLLFALFNTSLKSDGVYRGTKDAVNGLGISFKSEAARRIFKIMAGMTAALIVIFLIGSLLSSSIINASAYQKLMKVETGDFSVDISEVSYDKIPVLDRDSAVNIGNRVMGTMVDIVSQFEVDERYSQINYNDRPVRVSPLKYGSFIKWITNNADGVPGYVKVDMTTQQAEIVRLEKGIRYSTSEHFGRNIYRHLRFAYPTYIFDEINFEIDEDGTPYWICPAKKYNIGLFGGVTIGRVVLCNAVTGEFTDYAVEDVPEWVDKVYSAEMLIELYDYYGTLKHGYFNSVLGQKDCLQTTDGYNYIALMDDVWVYTGVTSVGQDESNVGFVLMNQRTMQTKYYEISGAEEYSAMDSAEGKVQHLGYSATFPLLLNVQGEPTYFMALKDSAGLVKSYAMLNIEKYQTVAIGDTVSECEKNYIQMMSETGITKEEPKTEKEVKGKILKIVPTVINGNTRMYIVLENSSVIYDVSVADNPQIIMYEAGSEITLMYQEGEGVNTARLILQD